jgi:apolipoprotein D and lipocalin family protein
MRKLVLSALVCLGLAGCGGSDGGQTLAPHVDLARYSGRWYVIANIPYFAEQGMVGSYFDISFKGDKLTDIYTGRKGTLDAPEQKFTMRGYVVPDTGNARWRERPIWPLYLSYLILYVDPDYKTALVGYPGKGYGWVLSRSPQMDDATYHALLGRFAAQGYDVSQFQRIKQVGGQS